MKLDTKKILDALSIVPENTAKQAYAQLLALEEAYISAREVRTSLRDTFAAAALPAVMGRGANRLTPDTYAKESYAVADAMLAAREGK